MEEKKIEIDIDIVIWNYVKEILIDSDQLDSSSKFVANIADGKKKKNK